MEKGGEERGYVEVKWMIKHQKAIKTRRSVKLPPWRLMSDALFISSTFVFGTLYDFMRLK